MGRSPSAAERLDAFAVAGIEPRSGAGEAQQRWLQLVRRAATSTCTILISGETGVGKEHLARWIHDASPRRDRAFIPVNCGAIPEALVDSQLFGHVRGAFTGATADHLGLIRAASGGTLFLDEVGELPLSAQTRLLRLLQEREVQPVGHPRPIVVDVRVIAASNRELTEAVEARTFREDLLFRLDVVRLRLKPLRERTDELPALVEAFNREFAELYGQPRLVWDRRALSLLRTYAWPGNIRQLRTVVERLHVLCPGEPVTPRRLREVGQLAEARRPTSPAPSLRRFRSDAVRRVLAESEGSVARTAEVFGVHRSTIYRWLKEQ